MATVKFTNSKSSIKKIYDYITQKSKTTDNLISTKDCLKNSAVEEMQFTKNFYKKNNGRKYIHIVQSFDPKDELTYEKANEIGVELAEYFEGFQAVISTHTDRKHIHNHILLNSVNFVTGYKFQQSKKDMENVKKYSDELCLKHGLSIIENPNKNTYLKQNEYQVALKGKSFKIQLMIDLDEAIKVSNSKENFINNMKVKGYDVNWSDNRKYITYTTPTGKKCRCNKLKNIKYTREGLENEFRRIETKSYSNESINRSEENRVCEHSQPNNTNVQFNNNIGVEFPTEYTRTYRGRNSKTTYRQEPTSFNYRRTDKKEQSRKNKFNESTKERNIYPTENDRYKPKEDIFITNNNEREFGDFER